MATYTSNYGWTKPSGSDNVDISVLNNNLDNQDSVIHNAYLNMAPPFSESSTYAVDDIVLYDTGLYKCHTPVVTPGSWTGSTNWQVYKLSEGGGGGGTSDYTGLTNKPQINGVTLTGNKTTGDLGINADNVMMSDGVTSVEDALDANSFGTVVDLASYSSSNPYTCPSDGYVVVRARELNGYVVVTVVPRSGNATLDVSAQATASNYVYNALFVKKGMKLYPSSTITTNLQARFVPLVM